MKLKTQIKDLSSLNNIAIPLIFTYLTGYLYTLADKAIIGRTSIEGFAAISVSSKLIFLLTGSLGLFGIAFNILSGKEIGQRNIKTFSEYFNTAIISCIMIGIGFQIVALLFAKSFYNSFYNLTGDSLSYACNYTYISSITVGIQGTLFIFNACFRNINKTKVLIYSSIIAGGVNLVTDYILVFGKLGFPELGPSGAAIGNVLGMTTSLLMAIFFLKKHDFVKFRVEFDFKRFKEMFKIFVPLSLQDLIEDSLFIIILTSIISQFGINQLATYNLIDSILYLLILPAHAYANAALTISSQQIGINNKQRVASISKMATAASLVFFILLSIIFLSTSSKSLNIITNDISLIEISITYCFLAVISNIFNITNQVYKKIVQSIGEERWCLYFTTTVSLISLLIIYVMTKMHSNLNVIYLGLFFYHFMLTAGYYIRINIKKIKNN